MHIQLASAVGQGTQAFYFSFHFCQFELNPLLVCQRRAKQFALLCPLHRPVNAIGQTLQATGCRPQPLFLELHHLVHKARTFLTDQVALWHPHFVKINQACVAGMHADLADFLRHLNTLGELAAGSIAHGHHDQAFVFVLIAHCTSYINAVTRIHQHAHPVGLQAVGDPHFLPRDDVIIAILAGMAFDGCHIAARTRLAHTYTADHVTGNRGCQKLAAQRIAAKPRQSGGTHIRLHANRHGDATAVNVAQRFCHRQRVGIIQSRAPIFFWLGQPQQPQVTQLFEHFMRGEDLSRLPLVHMRVDFFVNQAFQGLLNFKVFMGVVHGVLSMRGREMTK